jgi:hypothetical protein
MKEIEELKAEFQKQRNTIITEQPHARAQLNPNRWDST